MWKANIPFSTISQLLHTDSSSTNEPRHEKTCFCHMRTTKAQISLRIRAVWSPPGLFTALVRCLDSIIPLLAIAEISRPLLVSSTEQAGLRHTWSQSAYIRRGSYHACSICDVAQIIHLNICEYMWRGSYHTCNMWRGSYHPCSKCIFSMYS